jgi:uncharacterized protein (TIGR02285 family)
MHNSAVILFLISLCCYCAKGYAENTIYWLSNNSKAVSLLTQDPTIPESIVIDTTRLLMASLPQYQFDTEFSSQSRTTRMLRKLPNSCAPNRVKTAARLQDTIYSSPLNIALGLRLFYKEGKRTKIIPEKAINKDNELTSLPSLFTGKSTYILGINEGRSLGVFLDKQISTLDKHNLVIRSGNDSTTALVKMLLKDRIDYIIDYPISVNKVLNKHPATIKLDSLGVVDSSAYIVGYVACNKSPSGQKIIDDINKALQQQYINYEFYQAHTRYLDKSDIADFNQAYQTIFKVDIPKK